MKHKLNAMQAWQNHKLAASQAQNKLQARRPTGVIQNNKL